MGLVAGLLLAPERGSETRRILNRRANDLKNRFNDFVDGVADRFESFKHDAGNMATSATREAKSFAGDTRSGNK